MNKGKEKNQNKQSDETRRKATRHVYFFRLKKDVTKMNIAPQSGRPNDEHLGKSTKIDEIIVQKL